MSVQEPNSYYTQGFGTAYQKVEIPVISTRDPTVYDGVAPHSMPLGKRWVNSPTGTTWEFTSVYTVNGEVRASWSQTSGSVHTSVYPITPYVVGPLGQAGYQTIQSALDAAHAAGGGVVYIQPGRYGEDIVMYDKTSIVGVCSPNPNDTLLGATLTEIITVPASGSVVIENLTLANSRINTIVADNSSANVSVYNCVVKLYSGTLFGGANFKGTLNLTNITQATPSLDSFLNIVSSYPCVVNVFNCTYSSSRETLIFNANGGTFNIYNTYFKIPVQINGTVSLNFYNSEFWVCTLNDATTLLAINCTFLSDTSNACVLQNGTQPLTFINCNFSAFSYFFCAVDGATDITTGTITFTNAQFLGTSGLYNPALTSVVCKTSLQGDTFIQQGNLTLKDDGGTLNLFNGGTALSAVGISAAMQAGQVTVPCTIVTANSYIWVQNYTIPSGGAAVPHSAYISQITPGVDFTIVSADAGDNSSKYQYWVMNTVQP